MKILPMIALGALLAPSLVLANTGKVFNQPILTENINRVIVPKPSIQLGEPPVQNFTVEANTLPVGTTDPMIAVAMVINNNGIMQVQNSNVVNRSDANQRLCWEATNLPAVRERTIVELIQSPSRTVFNDPNSQVVSTNNGTTHSIYGKYQNTNNSTSFSKCWQFSPVDPVGNYQLKAVIDGVEFSEVQFSIAP